MADLTFERDKWLADLELRKRELDLKERDQQNRDAELRLKEREHRASTWRSPLIVAIFAAAAAAAGNAVVTLVNGAQERDLEDHRRAAELKLERSKAESVRILEMIRTGDENRAAANLRFLLKAGLIADEDLSRNLQNFLRTPQPGSLPSLPAPEGKVGFEKSPLLTEPLQKMLQGTLERYFAYLDRIGFPTPAAPVSVSIEAMEVPNAIYMKNRMVIDQRIADDAATALRTYNHHLLIAYWDKPWSDLDTALEAGLADYFACSFLNNPKPGEKSARIMNPKSTIIRTLANRKTYPPGRATPANLADRVDAWGGLFWDLRTRLGTPVADALIGATWRTFQPPRAGAALVPAFVDALLTNAQGRGRAVHDAVRGAADARKFPHS